MRLLDRYIITSIARLTALVIAVFMVLLALFLFINEQGWIGVGSYGQLQGLRYVLFNLPGTGLQFLPVAALFGALLAMGQLARGSELTVMRASGMSVARICAAVALTGMLLLPPAVLVGEWLAPPLQQLARETRLVERGGPVSLTRQGAWLRDGSRLLRAVDGQGADGTGGITVFELTPQLELAAVSHAAAVQGQADGSWQLRHVAGSRFDDAGVVSSVAAESSFALATSADFLDLAATPPREMSLRELARAIDYLSANGVDAQRQRFALWAGIGRLVAIPLAMLLAVPLVFGALRGAENAGRAAAGLLLGLAWYISQRMVESGAMAFALDPRLMATLPTLLLAAAVAWLLLRLPRVSAA
jgi:lipopolysaccharide export system permease protein